VNITEQIEREIKRNVYRGSYYEFFKWSFSILFPSEVYKDTFHIKYLCDLYQEEVERIVRGESKTKDIIVNIPPRTSKSLITSVCLIPWTWLQDPSIPFITVSFDEELANVNSTLSKDIILSDEFKAIFGDEIQIRKDINNKGLWQNNKGGFRLSKTTGSNITGLKGCIIIIDDPQNPKTAHSEVKRKDIIDYYTRALYNRLTPIDIGVRILIMQRLHSDDLTGYLLESAPEQYEHVCLPAEASNLVRPSHLISQYVDGYLDPARLGANELYKFKKVLRSDYAGQYDQTPVANENSILKPEWFDIIDPSQVIWNKQTEPALFYLDPAYSEKNSLKTNDPTGFLACFKRGNDLYLINVHDDWFDFPSICRYIPEYANANGYSHLSSIKIEGAASGKSIVQQLRSTTSMNIVEIPKPKDDKVARANAASAVLESRRVKLVKGAWNDHFLKQLADFPLGKNDDMVDVLLHAVEDQLLYDQGIWLI
jgi:predicted phage terminase large subunit-like protein